MGKSVSGQTFEYTQKIPVYNFPQPARPVNFATCTSSFLSKGIHIVKYEEKFHLFLITVDMNSE